MFFRNSLRLDKLEERLERLERKFDVVQADSDSAVDRVNKQLRRVRTEEYHLSKKRDAEEEAVVPIEGNSPDSPGDGRFLTARQRTIQQQILTQRARQGGKT